MIEGPGEGGVDRSGFDDPDTSLADVLGSAAEDLDGVVATEVAGTTTWTVGAEPFATLTSDRAEFRLDPLVARAALRTPETAASPRGPDWVGFAPGTLDDGAIDRAEAWFLSAHRRARGPGR